MGDPKGFLTIPRSDPRRLPIAERVATWREFYSPSPEGELRAQGARCMDCGVPFCQGDTGCPVQNLIPEWNDLVHRGRWREALDALHATNNFPELTGRLCPAPCESACVLGVVDRPVAIRSIEQAVADRGFAEGWIAPRPPSRETGWRVAVVGSGPAGLAAAQQLRRAGHAVTVFERDARPGGLLRHGIPDFKLEKSVLDRRLAQLEAEGVRFATGVDVGVDLHGDALRRDHDAVLLAGGAPVARELAVPGRALAGVHLAMDFLSQQNRRVAGDPASPEVAIDARGKRVVVIGGGDTGSDCVGTCHRQGASEVTQLELLPQPPAERHASTPWPLWPMQLRTSHAHEEGGRRDWRVATTELVGRDGRVTALRATRVGGDPVEPLEIPCDLVLLAMGFTGPRREGLLGQLGVALDARAAVATDAAHATSVPGVFAAGDVRRGASLLVCNIRERRDAAVAGEVHLRRRAAWRGARAAGAA
ncbi:glutamate synthase subunit beta [Roseisolibacter sp. H3M3-2]|uniref:glutamate synthase subunit beta n=1 Tax=Roseisolibacter sp. H3M3-2 TaxID=3031323 RepID=UPI0023DC561A|nr:glutamate synthase subunit beta [Roseisolibacter sp. H3M3-2]MDF1503379.1 glutamate synthase subunit beta [Roseisolibacter sp. H3M3-2]